MKKRILFIGALLIAALCALPEIRETARASTVSTCNGLGCVPGGRLGSFAPSKGTASRRNQRRRDLMLAATSKAHATNRNSTETPTRRLAAGGLSLAILLGGVWLLLALCFN